MAAEPSNPAAHGLRFLVALLASLVLVACGKGASKAAQYPVPGEEPPESAVVKILEQQYKDINQQGGLPVTVTATGRSMVLEPKIWEARKRSCKPLPQSLPGDYECSLDLMVTFRKGDTKPGKHAERVHVGWDSSAGNWVALGALDDKRKAERKAARKNER